MQSWSRVVDDIVRSGSSASLRWNGFTLATHFQPIYSIRRTDCEGYEALVRATDGNGRPIDAEALFAGAAREGELLLLDRACRALHLRNFATVDPGRGKLFLNVTPDAAIDDASCAREFGDLIRYYGLIPKRVCVEVLQHGCRNELELAEAVCAYREIGLFIAMDDFGTSCSNFDRIAALRPDLVKVERTMLAEAVGDHKARGLMLPLFDLLRESGAQIVVERIESATEALMAIDAGATFLQGNYLAAPAARLERDEFSAAMIRKLLSVGAPRIAVGAH